jgi:hypothetical protein
VKVFLTVLYAHLLTESLLNLLVCLNWYFLLTRNLSLGKQPNSAKSSAEGVPPIHEPCAPACSPPLTSFPLTVPALGGSVPLPCPVVLACPVLVVGNLSCLRVVMTQYFSFHTSRTGTTKSVLSYIYVFYRPFGVEPNMTNKGDLTNSTAPINCL